MSEKSPIDVVLRRFESPDETRVMQKGRFELVRIGGLTTAIISHHKDRIGRHQFGTEIQARLVAKILDLVFYAAELFFKQLRLFIIGSDGGLFVVLGHALRDDRHRLVVDEQGPLLDLDLVPGKADDAFNEVLCLILRIFEDDDLAALRLFPGEYPEVRERYSRAIDELVHQQVIADVERRYHRS